ncbi:MAG: DUF4123 domain-containing protein, partial [Aeromicrobium sp.]|nr:DUF4123 domain-containing protein [Burkholderiales bacterium]
DERPDWLACVYDDRAVQVSPHLVDVHAAHEAGQMDCVMAHVNATPAKLHVSIIDSVLTLAELAQHLRRFIMVRRDGGKNATLRFADCAVLPQLAIAFMPAQWAALVSPMARWHVHGYDGKLVALPGADAAVLCSPTPLVLTEQQLAALHEAMIPNMVLGCLRAMRHGAALPGIAADQHRWAGEACRLWRNARNVHDIVLRWLTSAALDTNGAVFQQEMVGRLLVMSDLQEIRAGLHAAVEGYRAKLSPMGARQ